MNLYCGREERIYLSGVSAGFEAAGKPANVAITATTGRLLTIIKAMLRDGTDHAPRPT